MPNLQQTLSLIPVVPKTFNKAVPLKAADPALLYGVELEIENTHQNDWLVPGLIGKEDGSLRNAGWEYITQPMTFSNLAYVLQNFFKKSGVTERNYSERCSVHVHANCQDLTVEQITLLLLLYQLFERVLFKYIGNDRDKNIFCVPWHETQLTYGIAATLANGELRNVKQWQKYTALNLLPLLSQGTVEFRHMAGTPNLDYILNWCNIIGCMFKFARSNDLNKVQSALLELNTTSHYRELMFDVFGDWSQLLMVPLFEADLEEGVLQMKYSLLKQEKSQSKYGSLWNRVVVDDVIVGGAGAAFNPEPLRRVAQEELIQAAERVRRDLEQHQRIIPRGARVLAPGEVQVQADGRAIRNIRIENPAVPINNWPQFDQVVWDDLDNNGR